MGAEIRLLAPSISLCQSAYRILCWSLLHAELLCLRAIELAGDAESASDDWALTGLLGQRHIRQKGPSEMQHTLDLSPR